MLAACRQHDSERVILVENARARGCQAPMVDGTEHIMVNARSRAEDRGATHELSSESGWTSVVVRRFSVGQADAIDDEVFEKISVSVSTSALSDTPLQLEIGEDACVVRTIGPVQWPSRACETRMNDGVVFFQWDGVNILSVSIEARGVAMGQSDALRCLPQVSGSWRISENADGPGMDAWAFGNRTKP
jgi:hypothetical protein